MKLGLSIPHIGVNATRENIIQLAQGAEKGGIDSLWVAERKLWPINPRTKYPGTPDGSLPVAFQNVLDPLSTLSFVAANTTKILLGTSVIDVPMHNPVDIGRDFATLDVLSEGRAIAGFGIGWSKDEYDISNVPFENRGKREDEFLEAIKKVWIDDIVEFDGEFYKIPQSKIGPKPIQKPYPKILLGGFNQKTFQRIAKYANGWLGALFGPIETLDQVIDEFKQTVQNSNKNPDDFEVTILTFPQISESSWQGEGTRLPMTGTVDEIGGDIEELKKRNIDRIILGESAGENYDVSQTLDYAKELKKFAD